jgi:hypothetical protein
MRTRRQFDAQSTKTEVECSRSRKKGVKEAWERVKGGGGVGGEECRVDWVECRRRGFRSFSARLVNCGAEPRSVGGEERKRGRGRSLIEAKRNKLIGKRKQNYSVESNKRPTNTNEQRRSE